VPTESFATLAVLLGGALIPLMHIGCDDTVSGAISAGTPQGVANSSQQLCPRCTNRAVPPLLIKT
jgi:hypothetical protein